MKKLITLVLLGGTAFGVTAQQLLPIKVPKSETHTAAKGDTPGAKKDRAGLIGIAGLNSESFDNINTSGKLSLYVRPLDNDNYRLTLYVSLNRNASNGDSLLTSTLLFPEVGNHSVLATLEYVRQIKGYHYFAPFAEFVHKNVKIDSDSADHASNRYFSTLGLTGGFKYIFSYEQNSNNVAFSLATYLSFLNVPDEDEEDFRFILKDAGLPGSFTSWGVKFTFQYNDFQIFADFRQLFKSRSNITVRELRGFNSNIGVLIAAPITRL